MREQTIYSKFSQDEMILRDYLAVYRTVLANEQALLSYVRTALAAAASGFTLVHFIEDTLAKSIGWGLIAFSIFILLYGFYRYEKIKHLIELQEENLEQVTYESEVPQSFLKKFLYWKFQR